MRLPNATPPTHDPRSAAYLTRRTRSRTIQSQFQVARTHSFRHSAIRHWIFISHSSLVLRHSLSPLHQAAKRNSQRNFTRSHYRKSGIHRGQCLLAHSCFSERRAFDLSPRNRFPTRRERAIQSVHRNFQVTKIRAQTIRNLIAHCMLPTAHFSQPLAHCQPQRSGSAQRIPAIDQESPAQSNRHTPCMLIVKRCGIGGQTAPHDGAYNRAHEENKTCERI